MARGGSSRSRAAARGAARAAATASRGGTSGLNSAGRAALSRSGSSAPASTTTGATRDAAAGLASLAKARAAAGVSAAPADLRRYEQEEAQAQSDLMSMGYSPEFVNQVSTFWQGIAKLPQDQQDKIMSQLKSQANATVDFGFDAENAYLSQLKAAKQKNYDDQLALFLEAEKTALAKNIGETDRGTASQLQSAYAGLAGNNAFDTGTLFSMADRAIEGRNRVVDEDTTASKQAIAAAQQQRDSASSLLSIQAEQDLNDVANRRTAARSQRLSQLIGLNASQSLLAQVPTLTQLSVPKATTDTPTKRTASTAAPLALPSMDAGGYRGTSYANQLRTNVASRKAARIQRNTLGNY